MSAVAETLDAQFLKSYFIYLYYFTFKSLKREENNTHLQYYIYCRCVLYIIKYQVTVNMFVKCSDLIVMS